MAESHTSTDNSPDSFAVRAAIRKQYLAARIALAQTPAHHANRSALIQYHLMSWFSQQAPSSFSFCAAVRGEFDCQPLAVHLISLGWRASMAVATAPAKALVFREWSPAAAMSVDHYGIPVPQTTEVDAPEVLLIPLVAYDDEGYRLGYGGGFFDRTLAGLADAQPKPIAIGVGFALSRVDSVLPQAHDQRMNLIVTENGIRATPLFSG